MKGRSAADPLAEGPSRVHKGQGSGHGTERCRPYAAHNRLFVRSDFLQPGRFHGRPRGPVCTGAADIGDRTHGTGATSGTAISIPRSLPTRLPRMRAHGRSPESPRRPVPQRRPSPRSPACPRGAPGGRQGQGAAARPRPCILCEASRQPERQQQARPQPCCKVLTHTEHSLSPRTLLAPSSSCADILIVLLWELAGSLSSGMARRGARAGCRLWRLPREAAHSDRLSNNLNLLRRACGTPAGPLYLLH